MSGNKSFNNAKRVKEDEFYTQIEDIQQEMNHYRDHFKDQVIFCNCDDPDYSNFSWFFQFNFDLLGLKKLITTHYNPGGQAYKLVIDGTKRNADGIPQATKTKLKGDGDFRSPEAINLLKKSDIVITNPPFSLLREYLAQLMKYDKKFLILGNQNAVTYKEVFGYIRDNKMWLGHKSGDMAFKVPDDYEPRKTRFWIDEHGQKWRSLGNICWLTNLPHKKRYEDIILIKRYYGNEDLYPKYDSYDAINIDKVKDIPEDYEGVMGVPITFLDKYNPDQFDIIGLDRYVDDNPHYGKRFELNGKEKYARILIRNRRVVNHED